MKRLLYIMFLLTTLVLTNSCKNVDEEPVVNLGYDSNYHVPDAEPLTEEDFAVIAAQRAEYDQNAK